MERNRISSLQSHGKALEKECCLPGVFCDSGDTPANLLCELNGHLVPCTSCFYGKWVEDMCTGQFGVFVYYYYYLIIIIIRRLTRRVSVIRMTNRRRSITRYGKIDLCTLYCNMNAILAKYAHF